MSYPIKHTGVIGMKWGVRRGANKIARAVRSRIKTTTTPSSDHLQYKALRKKKLKNLTDDEVRMVVKRMKLVAAHRQTGEFQTKQTRAMSNVELERGLSRQNLRKAIVRHPAGMRFKDFVKSFRMSDKDAKDLMNRINLENDYKNLKFEDYRTTKKIVDNFISYGVNLEK